MSRPGIWSRIVLVMVVASIAFGMGCYSNGPAVRILAPTLTEPVAAFLADTMTPGATRRPSRTPFPLTPTLIRILSPTDTVLRVQSLLEGNGGCRLPCWWGIEPGTTTWEDVYRFVAPLAYNEVQPPDPVTFDTEAWIRAEEDSKVDLFFRVENNLVKTYRVRLTRSLYYSPAELVKAYGTPSEIWLATYNDTTQEGAGLFYMVLFYDRHGFLASYYDTDAVISDGQVRKCYDEAVVTQDMRLEVWLWPSDEQPIAFSTARDWLIQTVPVDKFQRLEDTTALTPADFTRYFLEPSTNKCIFTPAQHWKSHYE